MTWYRPRAFAVDDAAELLRFVRAHPLATLVTYGECILTSHVPLIATATAEHIVLRGHLARANEQWRQTDPGVPAVAIFRGASHYISANWYPAKREHGRVVPTYDYEVVEARGTIRFFEDPSELRALVSALTDEHERAVGLDWRVDDAPASYVDGMLGAIVGFEIVVASFAGAYKLSQNHSRAARDGVCDGLEALGTPEARAVARRVREAGTE